MCVYAAFARAVQSACGNFANFLSALFSIPSKQAHDDLIRTYEARLVDLGIPESERNILVPRTNLTAAPAGLI
jgi:hypothetical protein